MNRIGLKAPGGKRENARWATGHVAQLVERGGLTSDNDRHERMRSGTWLYGMDRVPMCVSRHPKLHTSVGLAFAPEVSAMASGAM